jgi:hypothetical protein
MQRWFVYVLHGYIKTRINNKLLCIIYDWQKVWLAFYFL